MWGRGSIGVEKELYVFCCRKKITEIPLVLNIGLMFLVSQISAFLAVPRMAQKGLNSRVSHTDFYF